MEGKVGIEAQTERRLGKILGEIGERPAMKRFLSGYGKVRTKSLYVECLVLYRRWLREKKGVDFSFDAPVRDNLENVFGSDPVDVAKKRTHMDWMNEYANEYLVVLGRSESRRMVTVAAVRGFYDSNDSALFGHFRLASGPVPPRVYDSASSQAAVSNDSDSLADGITERSFTESRTYIRCAQCGTERFLKVKHTCIK